MTAQEFYEYLGNQIAEGKINPEAKLVIGNVYWGEWVDVEIGGIRLGNRSNMFSKYLNEDVVYVTEGEMVPKKKYD